MIRRRQPAATFRPLLLGLLLAGLLLTGCNLNFDAPAVVPSPAPTPLPTDDPGWAPAATETAIAAALAVPLPDGLADARRVHGRICFEAAYEVRDQVFVLRDALAHIRFYNDIDALNVCRRPVQRFPFDFSQGHLLAGLWSYGYGCKARHELIEAVRDDAAQVYRLRLRFVTEGDCNYELLRPYWVAVPPELAAYDFQIEIVR